MDKFSAADPMLLRPGSGHDASSAILPVILAIVLGLGWLIHYPRVVDARALLKENRSDSQSVIVELDVTQNNLFVFESGQSIQFRVDAYPYEKYGVISGKVENVMGFSGYNRVSAQVRLPRGLVTDRNFRVPFSDGLGGEALVLIKDYRLYQRVFDHATR